MPYETNQDVSNAQSKSVSRMCHKNGVNNIVVCISCSSVYHKSCSGKKSGNHRKYSRSMQCCPNANAELTDDESFESESADEFTSFVGKGN